MCHCVGGGGEWRLRVDDRSICRQLRRLGTIYFCELHQSRDLIKVMTRVMDVRPSSHVDLDCIRFMKNGPFSRFALSTMCR